MQLTPQQDQALAQALEQSEAAYWSKLYTARSGLPAATLAVNGATACVLPGVDILAKNRVIGWGWTGRESAEDIRRLITFYRTHGCRRFFLQLSPLVPQADELTRLLEQNGFRRYNQWSKLWRPITGDLPPVYTPLAVNVIGREQADIYGQIIRQSFDWNDDRLTAFLASSVGRPGYRHYLVTDGSRYIAAAALHLHDVYASMAFAATLPDCRGRGAQSLLIHQRMVDAAAAGARYLVAETAVDRPERPAPSFRNLRKFGFELAYERDNWIYGMAEC